MPLENIPFEQTKCVLRNAYSKGRIEDALTIALNAEQAYPHERETTLYWKACLYSLLGNTSKAMHALQSALNEGIWWSRKTLESESDFDHLRNEPEYNAIADAMETIYAQVCTTAKAICIRDGQKEGTKKLLNLHWRNDNVEHYRRYFPQFQNVSMIYVQSSQVASSKGFCWDNKEKAVHDIEEVLGKELEDISVFSGTSQGAVIALRLALHYKKSYVGIMPALKDTAIVNEITDERSKYRFLVGERDDFYPACKETNERLKEKNIDSVFISLGDVGHYFPEDFEKYYQSVINEQFA